MKLIREFNEFQYTTDSMRRLQRENREFYQRLVIIEQRYGLETKIIQTLHHDFNGELVLLSFECDDPNMLKEVQRIYQQYYQFYPLKRIDPASGDR